MVGSLFVVLGLAAAPPERPPLTFAAQAEIILVDVVVLDRDGKPVRGLAREDFTVLEDGRPQPVVGFEARDLGGAPGGTPAAATAPSPADPGGAVARGRTIALVIDDLGIAPLQVTDLKKAVKRWLDTQADPRDEVTVVTASGDLWWSDSVASGKADLLAVVERVQSRKPSQGQADYMTDVEAYQIDTYEDVTGARAASAGPPGQAAGPPTGPTPTSGFGPADITGRVAARWASRGCTGNCRTQVQQRAREIQDRRVRRTRAVFGAVERLSKAMSAARGRKTIVVFSDGLLRDRQLDADDRAADAAQLGNTAVSFVDTRGLTGSGMLSLDQATAPLPGDVALMNMEEMQVAAAGTAFLAEETGGSVVTGTNDLAEGLGRVVDESSAYYLLGYEPPKTPDGKWHKLEVKVARPGVEVRARRRYFAASGPERKGAPSASPEKGTRAKRNEGEEKLPARAFDPAILTSGDDTLSVRIAPYVMEPGAGGNARVLVALEIDLATLALGGGDKRAGRLDLTLMGVSRDQPKTDLLDQRLELELDPGNAAGWFTLSRELKLPAGISQVRALVRDASTGRMGRAWSRFQVPALTEPYLSTPVLTDQMEKQADGTPRLVPVAHREFSTKGSLFLQYEIHGLGGNARVGGGYRLSTASGDVIVAAERTPITRAGDGRLVRILGFPLEGLREGDYQIVLDVLDDASGKRLAARLPFRLATATP
jgi:VWFA-related protein